MALIHNHSSSLAGSFPLRQRHQVIKVNLLQNVGKSSISRPLQLFAHWDGQLRHPYTAGDSFLGTQVPGLMNACYSSRLSYSVWQLSVTLPYGQRHQMDKSLTPFSPLASGHKLSHFSQQGILLVWIRSLPFIPEVPCSKLLTADWLYGLYTSVFGYQALANCLLFHPMKCLTPRLNTLWDAHCAHRLVGKSYLYEAGSSSPSPSLDYFF